MKVENIPPDSIATILDQQLSNLHQYQKAKWRKQKEREVLAEKLSKLGVKIGLLIKPDPSSDEIR